MKTALIAFLATYLAPLTLVQMLALLAILAAGYTGAMHLALTIHVLSSSIPVLTQLADTCLPSGTHC